MANRPILQIMHAGYGTTPPCPQAKFAPGDVVKVRRLSYLKHLPERAAIALVVPPGFPPEYAMADARGEPRPLMTTVPKRIVTYIVAFDGDPRPQLIREANLLPTKEPRVEVGWTTDTTSASSAEATP